MVVVVEVVVESGRESVVIWSALAGTLAVDSKEAVDSKSEAASAVAGAGAGAGVDVDVESRSAATSVARCAVRARLTPQLAHRISSR